MTTTVASISAALLAFLIGAGGDDVGLPAPQGKTMRIFPAGQLVAPFVADDLPDTGPLLGQSRLEQWDASWHFRHGNAARLFTMPSKQPMDVDLLIQELRQTSPGAWEQEGASILSLGGRIYATHDRGVLDRVGAHLDRLRRTVAPRVRIRWICFEADGDSVPVFQRLSLQDAERMLAEAAAGRLGEVVRQGAADGRAGDRTWMGVAHRTWAQHDLSVEVAKKAKIGDPNLRAFTGGEGLACLPLVRTDGKGLAVFCFFSQREIDNVRAQDIVSDGLKHVELLDVEQAQAVFSTALGTAGGVLLAPGGAEDPDLRVLVVLQRLDEAPEPTGESAIVPTGMITSGAARAFMLRDAGPGVQFGRDLSSDQLIELARQLSGGADHERFSIWSGPVHVSIRGEQEHVAAARRAALFATKHLDRSFVIELAAERRRAGASAGTWEPHGQPIVIPVLAERVGYALSGIERSYVADFNVEIAEESTITDPVIGSVFAGTQVVAGVEPIGETCRVQLLLLARGLLDLRRVAAGAEGLGAVWCPEESEVRFRRDVAIAPGGSVSLGDGPLRRVDGSVYETRLTLRLREL